MANRFAPIPFTVLVAVIVLPVVLSGCHEADVAIDFIVGKRSAAELLASDSSPLGRLFAASKGGAKLPSGVQIVSRSSAPQPWEPRRRPTPSGDEDIIVVRSDALPEVDSSLQQKTPARKPQDGQRPAGMKFDFTFPRDPFMPPSEAVPPTECLPSMPLCRYDYTQLKLRGLIRLADGQYKGMVEDPEGRGFFITPGVQIRGATVTQVTAEGVVIYIHKTKKVDLLRIEGREARGR
ncbi:MAG: hypothetical protein ACP5M0_01880 [Desulfomonilaceae bacterium]